MRRALVYHETYCEACGNELSQRIDNRGKDVPALVDADGLSYCDVLCADPLSWEWHAWLVARCPWAKSGAEKTVDTGFDRE